MAEATIVVRSTICRGVSSSAYLSYRGGAMPYSPECVEWAFCEVRIHGVFGSSYGPIIPQARFWLPRRSSSWDWADAACPDAIDGEATFSLRRALPRQKWLREIRQQRPKGCLRPHDSSQIHRPLVIRQEESVTPKTRRHRPTAETSFRGHCVELGCTVWCSGATNLRPWERGEGADATALQTQAYEASASPIFCPVLWPCVGEVRAMN
jgi:hypothetical protein